MKILSNDIAIIDGDTHISKWVIEQGRLDHDQNMLPLLDKYLYDGAKVLDVGAYIGDHTIYYARKVGDEGIVYAYEPNIRAYKCLEYNLRGFDNVVLKNAALGDKESMVNIIEPNKNYGMARSVVSDSGIECTTIDSIGIDFDFIKIDAEGFELNVLKGAKLLLERYKPVLLVEINKPALALNGVTFDDIIRYLKAYNYTFRNIYNTNNFDNIQFDIICE